MCFILDIIFYKAITIMSQFLLYSWQKLYHCVFNATPVTKMHSICNVKQPYTSKTKESRAWQSPCEDSPFHAMKSIILYTIRQTAPMKTTDTHTHTLHNVLAHVSYITEPQCAEQLAKWQLICQHSCCRVKQ